MKIPFLRTRKRRPKVLKIKRKQSGKRYSLSADKKRKALPPSKRVSKRGKVYYEYRKNRSDLRRKSGWI